MKPQHAGLNALKVLMILFVIFIHENPTHNTHGNMVMWWNSIVVVAVPVFFTLSGYFFFRGMDVLTMDVYKKKLATRFRTLFIPYMIWNCFPVLFVVAGNLYSIIFRGKSTDDLIGFLTGLWDEGLWHIWWDKTSGLMPFDSPLWYVRDLMILCVLSPLFYLFIRKIGWIFPLIVGILYLSPLSFPIGFSSTGLFFFSFGSTFALRRISMDAIGGGRYLVYGLALSLFILCNVLHEPLLHKLFIMSSCYAWILLFHQIDGSVINRIAAFSETVFFVLALHNIIVLANVGKGLMLIMSGSFIGLSYWIAPFISLFICIMLYYIIKKVFPQVLDVLCGGR